MITKRLYEMKVGQIIKIKNKNGDSEGSFIRVPSGWIYRYTERNSLSSCFIPYTDVINRTEDINLSACPFCKSTNVLINELYGIYYVECKECGSTGGKHKSKRESVDHWNNRSSKK